jgi:hypothetical protein
MTDNDKKKPLSPNALQNATAVQFMTPCAREGSTILFCPKTSGRLTIFMFLLVPFSQFQEHQNLGSVLMMPCWLGRVSFQQRHLAMS